MGKLLLVLIFHASFLLGGPAIWIASGFIPVEWLSSWVFHLITTLPTIASFLTLVYAPGPDATPTRRRSGSNDRAARRSRIPALPTDNLQFHRLWLSYWSCWLAAYMSCFFAGSLV